jgi:serine/threonine protein kinase
MEDQRMELWKTRPHLKPISLIGKGQFGGVYRAEDEKYNTPFAVKVISLLKLLKSRLAFKKLTQRPNIDDDDAQLMEIGEELVRDFLLEVRQINRVSSENIVKYLSHWLEGPQASNIHSNPPNIKSMISTLQSDVVSVSDTFLYIQMELCDTTLEKWLDDQVKSGKVNTILQELRNGALIQIASGLNDLHKEGILHCDLKPDNIFLQERNGKITFKIADFGNSKWFEPGGMDFLKNLKEDMELLAVRVFKTILRSVEQVHTDGEFYRENRFIKCTEENDKVYFRDCTCAFLISYLTFNCIGDPDFDKHILLDQHNFQECDHCIFDYWSRDFLSKYQTIELRNSTLELMDKVNNEEVFRYEIMVDNEADAIYSTTILKSCLRTAGLKVVALQGRKLLELNRQGQGNSIIDCLRDSGINLVTLFCYQVEDLEASLLMDMCYNLDRESINSLVIADRDMVGQHGVFIDIPEINWQDLRDSSKTRLLRNKIILQGRKLLLGHYIEELDSECLRLVLSDPNGHLEIRTRTSCVLPQPYIHRIFQCKKSSYNRIDDTRLFKRTERLVILSDSPGSGKSTVLMQLMQTTAQFDGTWSHMIRLNEFVEDLEKWDPSNDSVESLLLQITINNGPFKSVFTSTLEGKTRLRLVLLFDAVDEVFPDSNEKVTYLVKHIIQQTSVEKIILTTRPHLLTDLRKAFNTKEICLKLDPLSYTEQIQYIITVWGDTTEHQVVGCISSFDKSCASEHFNKSPLADPMILKLFAEQTKEQKYFSGSLRELYSAVVERKISESIKEKLGVDIEGKGIGAKRHLQKLQIKILSYLKWLALETVNFRDEDNAIVLVKPLDWDEDTLKRTLLIEGRGERIFFVHRTFAEYFFASFLSDSIDNISSKQLVELSFSSSLKTVRNFVDEWKLTTYFTQPKSIAFWNCVMENSHRIFQNQSYSPALMKSCPTEAAVLKSLLFHCEKDTIILFLRLDDQRRFLRMIMGEWEWVLHKLTEKVGSHWTANAFFTSTATNGRYMPRSLWNEVLLSQDGSEQLNYARQIWKWLRSNSKIKQEDKLYYLLRGEGDTGWPSVFWVVQNLKSLKFFSEILTEELELCLTPERLKKELMLVADEPTPKSNWLHAAASVDYSTRPPLSAIVEFGRKYLSSDDFGRLLFESNISK